MTATREHLAGLELALDRWNDGGPAIQYGTLLAELIEQAQSTPEPVQGEAVEVLVYRASLPSEPELGHWFSEAAEAEPQYCQYEPLMTVAQHNRIMAAASAFKGEPAFMWHKGATEDESEVVDVDCACPCCVPLYTAAAKPDAELVRQCIAQELATWEGDFKGPVHTAMRCLQVRIDAKMASLKGEP